MNLYCLITILSVGALKGDHGSKKFDVAYQWHYLNFTWNSPDQYRNAIEEKYYIPGNSAIGGMDIYGDKLYVALPRVRPGTPATVGYIILSEDVQTDVLITPFPNWALNELGNCDNLQNVQNIEVDKNGIMWVIDGVRNNKMTECPPKLVLIDLNSENLEIVHVFTFPEKISSSHGGFLNDLVIDHAGDDTYAYITESSDVDPGLIVYSRKNDKAWKLRDTTMFPEEIASKFEVDGYLVTQLVPIDGIALSPSDQKGNKFLYYCAISSYNLYSISTHILKDELLTSSGNWRKEVKFVGQRQTQSDGLMVDNKGDFYYGLLPRYAVAKWNVYEPFSTSKIIDENRDTMIWTDTFAFDNQGYLYLLCSNINKFIDLNYEFVDNGIKIRILKLFTGTNSYLH